MKKRTAQPSRKKAAGKHHFVDVKIGGSSPQGSLDFFSDGFACHVKLKNGKLTGSSIVSGKDFAAKVVLGTADLWTLEYIHKKPDETMTLTARLGRITNSTNLFGISHKNKTHDIKLAFSEKLGLNGKVTAKTGSLSFGLSFTKHGTAAVEMAHSGKDHDLSAKYYPSGEFEFKARVSTGGGELSIIKSRHEIKAQAEFSF